MKTSEMSDHWFWLTYLYPMRVIKLEGENVSFSLDEINNCTYDNALLCRIVGFLSNTFQNLDVKYAVCGDGALALSSNVASFSSNDLLLHYNNLLCKLLIGGIYIEAISNKDLTTGSLNGKNMIWPVNFGKSLSSNMHARVRMKLANNMESILLDGACSNAKTIVELDEAFNKGDKIISAIKNISTYYLITGVTEMMYGNWSSAVSNLWIVTEQITDFLWLNDFLTDTSKNPEIPSRLQALRQDNRTYSASVKQEILFQIGIIPADVYADIYSVRKARNKLVHEGQMVNKENATRLYSAVNALLRIAAKQTTLELLPSIRISNS